MAGNSFLMQDRDRRLLTEIAAMRLIDCDLTQTIGGFRTVRRANRRLLKLVRAGLLNRFFVGTVASGRKAIYVLSRKGSALVGSPHRLVSRRFGKTVVGDLFVDHQMHINRIYAAAKFGAAPEGLMVRRWQWLVRPLSQATRLIPDGYFELETHSGVRAHFLEADLGTETARIWDQKVRAYVQFASSGDFQRAFAQPQFRVLVVTTSHRRLQNIRGVIARHTDKIFYLTTFNAIHESSLWSALWLRPKGEHPQTLL